MIQYLIYMYCKRLFESNIMYYKNSMNNSLSRLNSIAEIASIIYLFVSSNHIACQLWLWLKPAYGDKWLLKINFQYDFLSQSMFNSTVKRCQIQTPIDGYRILHNYFILISDWWMIIYYRLLSKYLLCFSLHNLHDDIFEITEPNRYNKHNRSYTHCFCNIKTTSII